MSNAQQVLLPDVAGSAARARSAFGTVDTVRKSRRRLARSVVLLLSDAVSGALALITAQMVIQFVSGVPPVYALAPALGLLLLVFLTLGLYTDSAQCPYARFRLRCIGILLFVVLHGLLLGDAADTTTRLVKVVSEAGLLIALGFYVEMAARHLLKRLELWSAPTVIVGCTPRAQHLYQSFLDHPDLGFRPVGFIRTPADGLVSIKDFAGPVRDSLMSFAEADEELPVAILTSADQFAMANSDVFGSRPPRLILMSDASDLPTLGLRIRPLGNSVGIQLEYGATLSHNRIFKRLIDLCIAVPAAILMAPLIGALCLLVSVFDRGSPLYFQARVGARGATFHLPKLRTMYRDGDARLQEHLANNPSAKTEWERYFKLTDDPRVFPVIGNFLRRSSLDELPQLWSVIVGDMSLVGPRPFPQYHLNSFDAEFQRVRSTVVPGLTGLWQVTDRSNGDLDVQRTQDTFYIRNWSIWLDLYILFKTVPAVLTGSGAR